MSAMSQIADNFLFYKKNLLVYINCTKGFHCGISVFMQNMYFYKIQPHYSSLKGERPF
jgi:hypothetical protein